MINDYASLRSAIAQWLARGDLNDMIPTFIQLAESRINRELFVHQRQARVTGTAVGGVVTLPKDLYRIQSVRFGNSGPLNPVAADFDNGLNSSATGYSIVNGTLRVVGTSRADYSLVYWGRVPALTDAAPQNWLIEREPGLYLYGALIESAPVLKDDQRIALWSTLYDSAVRGVLANEDYIRYGNAPAMVGGYAP